MRSRSTLALVSIVAVFVFHWQAFLPATMKHFAPFHDNPDIRAGYKSVPDFWHGVVKWSVGPWINTGAGGYRPFSSFLHYWQLAALDNGYLHLITITTLLMLAGVCALAGALVTRWSSKPAGLVAAVLCALVPASWGVPGIDQFGWYVVTDNLLCLLGLLGALLAFDIWQESGKPRHAIVSLALLLFGCLSKEYAYIGPFMLAAMHFTNPHRSERSRSLWPVAAAFIMVAILFFYRRSILPVSHHGGIAYMIESNWWLRSGLTPVFWRGGVGYGLVLMLDQWLHVVMGSMVLVPLVLAVRLALRLRAKARLATTELLLFFSFLPIAGFGLLNHRLLYPWTFASIALAPGIWNWLQRLYTNNLGRKSAADEDYMRRPVTPGATDR